MRLAEMTFRGKYYVKPVGRSKYGWRIHPITGQQQFHLGKIMLQVEKSGHFTHLNSVLLNLLALIASMATIFGLSILESI